MRLCIAVLVLSVSLGAAEDSQATFRTLINQYWSAWSTGNADNASVYYAKEPNLVFFDVAPVKYTGWTEYRDGFKKSFQDVESIRITPNEDLNVLVRGNLAFTTHTAAATEKLKDGKSVPLTLRHTGVWEKRGGKWYIVHEHVSSPLQ